MKTLLHITLPIHNEAPVLSGKIMTEEGYEVIKPFVKKGVFKTFFNNKGVAIYTGIFYGNGLHTTWNFNPGNPSFPEGYAEGQEVEVTVVGVYTGVGPTGGTVAAVAVTFGGFTTQP